MDIGKHILRNIGTPLGGTPPAWRRQLLLGFGDRKAWVVAEGADHREATEKAYKLAEKQIAHWQGKNGETTE